MGGMRIASILLLAALVAQPAATATHGSDDLLISDAMVFDGSGRDAFRADVLVRDGRIAQVGPQLRRPRGVTVVDAAGATLMPGLFDVHTHWTPAGKPAVLSEIANAYIAHGVTTVVDYHQAPEAYAPRRQWLSRLATPDVRFVARVSTPLGHGADWADQATTRWVNSPNAARLAVAGIAPYKPDLVKVFTDGWRYGNVADNTSMDAQTLAAVVEGAHAQGWKVVTHTVTIERGLEAAAAGVDVIAHSLLDRPLEAADIAALKAAGIALSPTLSVYEPVRMGDAPPQDPQSRTLRNRERNFGFALRNVKALHDAGVPIALGTDAGMPGTPHGRATLHELQLLVRAGLTPAQALVVGTSASAARLGLDDRGRIAPGLRADLVLVDGAPWQDIAQVDNIRQVWIAGRQVHGPGTILPAANAQRWPASQPIGALIDDFERSDGRTALDTLRTDEADGGNDRTVQVTEVVAREDAGHALSVQARLSSKDNAYANVVLPLSRGSVLPVDLRRYSRLRLQVRGDAPALQLEWRGTEGARWRHPLAVDGRWREVVIDFKALEALPPFRGGGDARPWRGDDLQQLVIGSGGAPGETIWFELDGLRLE